MKAKDCSLISKIVGSLVILISHIILFILVIRKQLTVEDVKVLSPIVNGVGFCIMGIFGTVDINLLAEKFSINKEK